MSHFKSFITAICVLLATTLHAQTISISGSGTYTSFFFQSSPSAWSSISTPISFGFDFPPEVAPCSGCDTGTYRMASLVPESPMGLNPALDDFFNSHLSAIHPGLSTSLINSFAPENWVLEAANRSTPDGEFAKDQAIYVEARRDNWTTVLSDGEFTYGVQWQSYVEGGVARRDPDCKTCVIDHVSTPFDANAVVSMFEEKPVRLDDWIHVVKRPIATGPSDASYFIEAKGSGNIVAAIPEPEIYALMLAGLGLTGFIARRRRSLQYKQPAPR